jgi:hypothetical protein
MLSSHCKIRLDYFEELVNDSGYGKKKAIKGLKAWQSSQKHRLTSLDNAYIDSVIRRYSK